MNQYSHRAERRALVELARPWCQAGGAGPAWSCPAPRRALVELVRPWCRAGGAGPAWSCPTPRRALVELVQQLTFFSAFLSF